MPPLIQSLTFLEIFNIKKQKKNKNKKKCTVWQRNTIYISVVWKMSFPSNSSLWSVMENFSALLCQLQTCDFAVKSIISPTNCSSFSFNQITLADIDDLLRWDINKYKLSKSPRRFGELLSQKQRWSFYQRFSDAMLEVKCFLAFVTTHVINLSIMLVAPEISWIAKTWFSFTAVQKLNLIIIQFFLGHHTNQSPF